LVDRLGEMGRIALQHLHLARRHARMIEQVVGRFGGWFVAGGYADALAGERPHFEFVGVVLGGLVAGIVVGVGILVLGGLGGLLRLRRFCRLGGLGRLGGCAFLGRRRCGSGGWSRSGRRRGRR